MRSGFYSLIILLMVTFNGLAFSQMSIGGVPPEVRIRGDQGGKVAGGEWSSSEIRGKVFTVMYVDPDEKEINEHVERSLKAENYPRDQYGSMAIVNTAATWKPDAVIKMILKGKQKDYPDTIYIMDRDKVLVKKWGLKDDSYHVLTFAKDGKLLYTKSGPLNEQDIQKLKQIIRANL
ncbi:MAG: YtfJ family protein [Saprospiraceae bacterium]|nr:YtfJ family protein [Saprospiraceae bacterium]